MGKSRDIKRTLMKHSLTNKLLIWFLLVSLLPLSLVGYISFRYFAATMKSTIANDLYSVAESKTLDID